LCSDNTLQEEHAEYIRDYFREEVFPFLEPVLLMKDEIRFFIRDNRLYQVACLKEKATGKRSYAIIKIPYSKVPRFIELPVLNGQYYFLFIEDLIAANLSEVFIGYEVEGSYNIKISRDADIYIDEEITKGNVKNVIKKVKKRKIGDISRFVYDRRMPQDCLDYLQETFRIHSEDQIPDYKYLNLEDLNKLPNPFGKELEEQPIVPIRIPRLDKAKRLFTQIRKQDIFFNYPYHSFDYFLRFLNEAANNPRVEEIKVTQYRVAEQSEVINNLLVAAKNGKKVTVFVELKARFDEENNLYTAEQMKQAGIKIIYSIPGLKVHAKVALVREKTDKDKGIPVSYAYLSTGNFHEKTAKRYSDMAVMTAEPRLTEEVNRLFNRLESRNDDVQFEHLLVTKHNMVPELQARIRREIEQARQGKKAYILLKMNSLQDPAMINELYQASEAGVEIDLIVRGICCLIPDQAYSRNIRITRIVDQFLEHSRVWYFYNNGEEDLFLSSADWMKRNLYRRIEAAFPIYDRKIKKTILEILNIQLNDNIKACYIGKHLENLFKHNNKPRVWAQRDTYKLLSK
ncbi:polyphosphate kinase 1, partial [Bacteroidales bacterium OttesenSCG-928-L03]|nr:polyphosphate kinase 1 [Bacteroidales bacterium OttesenSCG-928-L03]